MKGGSVKRVEAQQKRSAPRIVAAAAMCLFFLRAVAFVVLPNGPAALGPHSSVFAAVTLAKQFCAAAAIADGKTPPPHREHHENCIFCVSPSHASDFDRTVSPTASALSTFWPVFAALIWPTPADSVTAPLGWASSWSSRAPPSLS
ncbi:MAG: hypothetical protein ACLPSW_32680 [Roseiarcus sp.]